MHRNESEWRATKQRPHKAPVHKPTLPMRKVAKWLLVIMALAALYGTLKPECRGYQQSTPAHCVD